MSICISTSTLTSIAIDRYILIIHPTKKPINKHQALIMIGGIWVLAIGIALPSTFQYVLLLKCFKFYFFVIFMSLRNTRPCYKRPCSTKRPLLSASK